MMSDPEGPPPRPSITPAEPVHGVPSVAAPQETSRKVAPAATPPPQPVAAPAVTPLRIQIVSTPPGAEIRYGKDTLGVAPLDLSVSRMVASHPIQARLQGHRDSEAYCRVTEEDLKGDTTRCEVSLKRLRKTRSKAPSTDSPPVKSSPSKAKSKGKPKIHMID
jgi:hypothetical protein